MARLHTSRVYRHLRERFYYHSQIFFHLLSTVKEEEEVDQKER